MRPGRLAAVVAVSLVVLAGCDFGEPAARSAPSPAPAPATSSAPAEPADDYAPPRFAGHVRTHAKAAGVNPVLLMAILYNEWYKPHDPDLERAWQKLDPNAAFGVANMHKAAFDDTKQGRSFADRDWTELPDDPDLAIEAAAWYLHDLRAGLSTSDTKYSRDDLLGVGYNAGPGHMAAVAAGERPNAGASSYVAQLHENWRRARQALR